MRRQQEEDEIEEVVTEADMMSDDTGKKQKKQKKVKEKKQKEVYIEKTGIFGKSIDYAVYHKTLSDCIIGYLAGLILLFVAFYIFFNSVKASIFVGIIGGFAGVRVYAVMKKNKRMRTLRLQFKDMLESLATSIGAGKNTVNSFADARKDMANQYGEHSYIVGELDTILVGVRNNIVVEDLLLDFGERAHDEDIVNFADVFAVANRQGGNMAQIILETKNCIKDKIEIELEIQTMVSGNKNQLNIMMLMPFVIVGMVKQLQDSGTNATTIIVNLVALGIFGAAYALGQKFIKVKV